MKNINIKLKYWIICLFLIFTSCENNTINYHDTPKKPVVDIYFGTEIKDNYRWLEDDLSLETENWVKKQNKTTFKLMIKLPNTKEIGKKQKT